MKRHHDEGDVAEMELLYRFTTSNGKSIAVSISEDEIEDEPIFLPIKEITVQNTDRTEGGHTIIKVAMPQWLAEDRELV